MQGRDANPEPYSMFKAAVSVDEEEVANIGIRKKGNLGSVVSNRPSLKLDFDEFVDKQEFRGVKGLTLNNNHQNGATLHQYLAYYLFRKAGVPAPQCNLAHVVVNGEDLGIYSNVEPIKKAFLKRTFGSSGGNLYESGGKFEGEGYRYFPKKNNRKSDGRQTLKGVTEALAKPDSEVLEHLDQFLDIEAFYRFWAMDVLIGDWDGFICNRNNAYLYSNPNNGKLYLIPWGMDSVFEDPGLYFMEEVPKSVKAVTFLPRRLYGIEASQNRYLEVVQELLEKVWDEKELEALIESAKALIRKRLHFPESHFLEEMQIAHDFILGRRGEIQEELTAGVPEWPQSANREPMSGGMFVAKSKFEGIWKGPLTISKVGDEGQNVINLSFEGGDGERLEKVAAYAGIETQAMRIGYPVVVLEGRSAKLGNVDFRLYIDPFEYGRKQSFLVDFYEVFGVLIRRPESSNRFQFNDFLGFAIGQLSLSQSSEVKGEAVSGEFELQVILK